MVKTRGKKVPILEKSSYKHNVCLETNMKYLSTYGLFCIVAYDPTCYIDTVGGALWVLCMVTHHQFIKAAPRRSIFLHNI